MTQSREVKGTEYVVVKDNLRKGITLSEYVKLKGLTEKHWLLIKDFNNNGKLITGVRADGLVLGEKDYYVVTVENYIFPQYTDYSERGYYIVIYISKTPVDLIPTVCTETEIKVPAEEPTEQATSEQVPAEVMATIDEPHQPAKDKDGNRYAKCTICGKIDIVENFAMYGGTGHYSRGKCMDCVRQQGSNMIYID